MVTRCKKCNKLFATKIEEFGVYCENCEKILKKDKTQSSFDKAVEQNDDALRRLGD